MRMSTGYSTPSTTGPAGVMRSTPRPSVSTRWTLGRLKACRYWSWKVIRLQCFDHHGLSLAAVSGSSTTSSMRWRKPSITAMSRRSSSACSSGVAPRRWVSSHSARVHPSSTMSTAGWAPVTASVKLMIRSCCHPGAWLRYQASSVGAWPRTPTAAGVRWKTKTSPAVLASSGTTCTAVAPVPMMPTRLPASFSIGSVGLPPVTE